MDIYMTGINYDNATLKDRERFSLTAEQQKKIAKQLIDTHFVKGCVFLTTCNRSELWISGNNPLALEFFIHQVLEAQNVEPSMRHEIEACFTVKRGEEALEYLLELACGIHSQIFGEDQILTQLKQAAENAREHEYIDGVLETLFRTAVTGAKKVKTKVCIAKRNRSLPEVIVTTLEEQYGALKGRQCLVIGNGEMGRLMASYLVTKGAKVAMTLRQYKKKEAIIPSGCDVVLYEDRYHKIEENDYIFSATRSPHYTIKTEEIQGRLHPNNHYLFVDMALPRDIEPRVSRLPNVTLLHMDDFKVKSVCGEQELEAAKKIIKEYKGVFDNWYHSRSLAPLVEEISDILGKLTDDKLTKAYKTMKIAGEEKEYWQASIHTAVKKSVSKLLFGLQEYMEMEYMEGKQLEEAPLDKEQYMVLRNALEQITKNSR